MHEVAADLMLDPSRIALPGTSWSVIIDVAPPTGPAPLDLDVKQSTLRPDQLPALREVLDRHARRIVSKQSPMPVERIVITADQALITVDSVDATENFRRAGCMDVTLLEPKGVEIECAADRSACAVKWVNNHDLGLDLCNWTSAQAEERLERTLHDGRSALLVRGLGARTLLYALGFRPGDIVQNEVGGELVKLRQAQLWSEAARVLDTERSEYRLILTRGRRTSKRTITVVGRAASSRG